MDGKVYRIKPLEWCRLDEVVSFAECVFGRLRIRTTILDKYAATCDAKHGHTVYVDDIAYSVSLAEAKAATEEWYVKRLQEALIET